MNKYLFSIMIIAALVAIADAQPSSSTGFDNSRSPATGPPVGAADGRVPANESPLNPMFTAIDADGDGVITTRELRKAVAALKKMDADRDGNITLDEVNAQLLPSNAIGQTFGRGGPSGGRNNFGGPAGRDGIERQQINQQYMQNDRNGDGRLTPDEVPPQLRSSLRGGDANNDGTIDAQELQAVTQRMSERFRGGRPLPPGFDPRAAGERGGRRQP